MSRHALLGLLLVLATLAGESPLPAQGGGPLRPAADHHGHLQSLEVWRVFNAQLLIATVPPDLDRLLRGFEQGWLTPDNKVTLAALFTDDGVFQWGDDWLRGRAAIRMMLVGNIGPLRLRPQTFETGDALGHVAGSYGFYRDTAWVDQGRFLFALRCAPGGPWQIAAAILRNTTPPKLPSGDPYDAAAYLATLDSVGIRRGVALSWAYQIAAAFRDMADEAARVRAENDWVARQAARFPERLVAFCSLNPLRDYAFDELARCMRDPRITGLKLHLTTAFFDFRIPAHVQRLGEIFRAADARRFPIVIHLRTMNPAYGRRDAEIFLAEVLPKAPDTPVQVAHLAGWGGYGAETEAALGVFANAFAARDRRVANVWFDLSNGAGLTVETGARLVERIRRIGVDRILFGLDRAESPAQAWQSLIGLPFTSEERKRLATNLAPYLR